MMWWLCHLIPRLGVGLNTSDLTQRSGLITCTASDLCRARQKYPCTVQSIISLQQWQPTFQSYWLQAVMAVHSGKQRTIHRWQRFVWFCQHRRALHLQHSEANQATYAKGKTSDQSYKPTWIQIEWSTSRCEQRTKSRQSHCGRTSTKNTEYASSDWTRKPIFMFHNKKWAHQEGVWWWCLPPASFPASFKNDNNSSKLFTSSSLVLSKHVSTMQETHIQNVDTIKQLLSCITEVEFQLQSQSEAMKAELNQ